MMASRFEQQSNKLLWQIVWRSCLLVGVGLTVIYVIVNMLISSKLIDQPFTGFLHQNRVVFQRNLPNGQLDGELSGSGFNRGLLILKAEDSSVLSSARLNSALQNLDIGRPVQYMLLDRDGEAWQVPVVVHRFTWQSFVQFIAIPALFAAIILVTVGTLVYLKSDLPQVRLFALFSLAVVFHLTNSSNIALDEKFAGLVFVTGFVGRIVAPPLMLHFLLLFHRSRNLQNKWPFLLPLIYFPVLPALIHLPGLFIEPLAIQNLDTIINGYTLIYALAGVVILIDMLVRSKDLPVRRQAAVLMIGLLAPTVLLLFGVYLSIGSLNFGAIFNTLNQYAFVGVALGVMFLAIRYESFGIKRTGRSYFFYLRALFIALFGYACLIAFVNPASTRLDQLRMQDIPIILLATAIFFVIRFGYHNFHRLFMDFAYGSIEELQTGYRLISKSMLQVESQPDLERLISWDLPSDFRLRGAELVIGKDKPNMQYALRYPLSVSNLPLGVLFLGGKINGKSFTEAELEILNQLSQQLSLVVWSIELDRAIQGVEELTRLKSKFLAHVTHELRTPLNGIINYIGFVLDDYRDSLTLEQIDHLEQALTGAEKLLQIINNILDMSKIEAGQMTLNVQSTNLVDLVNEAESLVREMIKNKPVRLITEISSDLPKFQADRLRMRQILLNILSNAVKFTEIGTIHLSAYQENGWVTIKITDTGPGIDGEILSTIFDQFVSAGLTDMDKNLGPRLSMPITKSLVELHGGEVRLDSRPGQGTTFTVTIPIQ